MVILMKTEEGELDMKVVFMILVLGLLLSGCSSKKPYQQISMDEAIAMMDKEKDVIILDVRTEEEYEEGHIPGAINVPNETITSDGV